MRRIQILLLAALVAGCEDRPRAPALSDDAAFDDSRHGLRFQAPAGWRQVARSNSPGDIADREFLLARFQSGIKDKPAVFEVTFIDISESVDVQRMLAAPSHSLKAWTPAGSAEAHTINGAAATRYAFTQAGTNKDAFVFPRGKRLYTFSIAYGTADQKSLDQFRESVKSVEWSK